jgi:hypothetical protein
MALVGERGRLTWRGWHVGEAAARAPTLVGGGRGKGMRGRWAGSACWPLVGLDRRLLGQKAEQAGKAAGPTGPELKRNYF